MRKGATGSVRGAGKLTADLLATVARLRPDGAAETVLVRVDSAFYAHPVAATSVWAGARVSLTVRMDPVINGAVATISDSAWHSIKYPNAVFDEDTGTWISKAQVAEVPFTAFSSRK